MANDGASTSKRALAGAQRQIDALEPGLVPAAEEAVVLPSAGIHDRFRHFHERLVVDAQLDAVAGLEARALAAVGADHGQARHIDVAEAAILLLREHIVGLAAGGELLVLGDHHVGERPARRCVRLDTACVPVGDATHRIDVGAVPRGLRVLAALERVLSTPCTCAGRPCRRRPAPRRRAGFPAQVRGDGEGQPHVHAARVALDRRVEELLDLGERDDLVEACASISRARHARGSRRSGRCSRGRSARGGSRCRPRAASRRGRGSSISPGGRLGDAR